MQELNSETNIVEALRSKLEESDVKQYLKGALGGYTRSSVLEYLNVLRKQQQSMAETFSCNQQTLLDEKEQLKKANELLKDRLGHVESEYKTLCNSLQLQELDSEDISVSDIAALKENISVLGDELNNIRIENNSLQKQIDQYKQEINELSIRLENSEQEKLSIKEIAKAEMMKARQQSGEIAKLTGTLDQRDEEIKFLNSLITEGKLAELKEKVNELTEQLVSQAEILTNYNSESNLKSKTIETLTNEKDDLKQRNNELFKDLNELISQKDKQLADNKVLTEELESAYKKNISNIKEKSALTIDKLELSRKLDEANSKIVLLELLLKKQTDSEKI